MNFWKCKQLCARAGTDPLCFLLTDVLGYLHRHFGLSQPFLLESELQVGSWQLAGQEAGSVARGQVGPLNGLFGIP